MFREIVVGNGVSRSGLAGEFRRWEGADMAAVDWDPVVWAEVQFGTCKLGDRRRSKRLVNMAQQFAARPDASTPQQTETWGDLKAAYRLFDTEDVTPAAIREPHYRMVRG